MARSSNIFGETGGLTVTQEPFRLLLLIGFASIASAQSTNFTATGSVQTYTVPPGVIQVKVDAAGAQGGHGVRQEGDSGPLTPGGKGARLVATFAVTPGETLNIVVGGAGSSLSGDGGGGGGSFVYRTATQPGLLIAAAGGGGAAQTLSGSDGSATNTASDGGGSPGSAGTGGNGGAAGPANAGGGGGGGLLTNGGSAVFGGAGGIALLNGAAGGAGSSGGNGGFGGGGGAGSFGAGAGGGYNGGGGGEGSATNAGGGGGSYSASPASIATSGFESGDGYVTITVTEVVPTDAFQVNYAANLQAGDSFINISNTGSSGGNLCANVYVFDPSEEMVSCCSCLITPNALQSLSVQGDLISNTLSPSTPQSVAIKILASSAGTNCNPSSLTLQTLEPGLRAWGTRLHALPTNPVNYGVTETGFLSGGLSPAELMHLTSFCGFVNANGSGFGICKSCRTGGLGGAKH